MVRASLSVTPLPFPKIFIRIRVLLSYLRMRQLINYVTPSGKNSTTVWSFKHTFTETVLGRNDHLRDSNQWLANKVVDCTGRGANLWYIVIHSFSFRSSAVDHSDTAHPSLAFKVYATVAYIGWKYAFHSRRSFSASRVSGIRMMNEQSGRILTRSNFLQQLEILKTWIQQIFNFFFSGRVENGSCWIVASK